MKRYDRLPCPYGGCPTRRANQERPTANRSATQKLLNYGGNMRRLIALQILAAAIYLCQRNIAFSSRILFWPREIVWQQRLAALRVTDSSQKRSEVLRERHFCPSYGPRDILRA